MTIALIALFLSLAVCAVIGWAVIQLLRAVTRRVRPRSASPSGGAAERSIIFWESEPDDIPDDDRVPQVRRDIETYFEKGRWKNKVHGSSRAANTHETKAAAEKVGRDMARKRRVEHIVMKKDGTIGQRTSYRSDTRSVPG